MAQGAPNATMAADEVRAHYARLATDYDRKANRACKRAYRRLIQRTLGGAQRVLELGAGATDLLAAADAPFKVAGDLSMPMLGARPRGPGTVRVVADAQRVPCRDGSFDAVFCVNLLEHVPDPGRVLAEAARVLAPGGRCLAITPNGDLERLLDLLERLRLKLPEGPHRFLAFEALAAAAGDLFEVVEHRRFAAFPLGPPRMVETVDRLVQRIYPRGGLFQYILLRKPARRSPES